MNSNIVADKCSDNVGLQIGEGENEIRLQRKNLRNICGDECRDTWLLAPNLWRSHGIAGNPGYAVFLAEEIKRLDGLLGQTDDSLRRKHALGKHIDLCRVEQFDAAGCRHRSRLEHHDASSDSPYLSSILLGQTDDSLRRKHALGKHIDLCRVEQFDAAGCRHRSRLEPHYASSDSPYLSSIMTDVNKRYTSFITQAFQIRQDVAFACGIERSERFVQQQQARAHQQGTTNRDTLALSAGKLARPPVEQMANIKEVDHMLKGGGLTFMTVHPAAVFKIATHRKVREQATFLKHVADAPSRRWHVDLGGIVEEHFIIERDAASVGRQ